MAIVEPAAINSFMAQHVSRLAHSHARWTGQPLLPGVDEAKWAETLYAGALVVVSHGTQDDPVFNYGNLAAQRLFEMTWAELTALPSRCSAEPVEQAERARLMTQVAAHGFIDDYRGIRISSTGQRFMIEQATVWNVLDEADQLIGQAAAFSRWTPLA